jgi:hypothetical protein
MCRNDQPKSGDGVNEGACRQQGHSSEGGAEGCWQSSSCAAAQYTRAVLLEMSFSMVTEGLACPP